MESKEANEGREIPIGDEGEAAARAESAMLLLLFLRKVNQNSESKKNFDWNMDD